MDKEIAIILPCRNSKRVIGRAIESILRTRYPFKLIIVESESTDGTAELVQDYAKRFNEIEVYHTKKEGLVKAINFGINKAGDRDVYLTQDDAILPELFARDWLTEMVKIKRTHKDVGLITSIRGGGISGDLYVNGFPWIGTWSMYIPRETIDKIGLFDEQFGPGDDIDYCYRVFLAGLQMYEANFWIDHHRKTEHGDVDGEAKIKLMAEKFRRKWKIGEFAK